MNKSLTLQKNCCRFLLAAAVFILANVFSFTARAQSALSLGGTNAYVSFGGNSTLQLSQFTLECWFKRTGTGIGSWTDTLNKNPIPLITKGRTESESSVRDINYFFGIDSTTNVLMAEMEEGLNEPNPHLNHTVYGVTPIANNMWYHGAVTYDGTYWCLYLNGALEKRVNVGFGVQSLSVQYAALGTGLSAGGVPTGYFAGVMDEARIWNYARTQVEIESTINSQITSAQAGLVAGWGLNEGTGTAVNDASGNAVTGNIIGANYAWVTDTAPFNIPVNLPPAQPSQVFPMTDSVQCISPTADLSVNVTDPEGDEMDVTFFIRQAPPAAPRDFTLVTIPDTQYYCGLKNGGTNEMFKAQTNWIVNHIDSLNIVYAQHLGDCVELGDNGGDNSEWLRCDTAMKIIENPLTTHLPEGVPYGILVGNHDETPRNDATGTTAFFNQFFGTARFGGRSYYGGHYGTNNNASYWLFSASGMDFIVLNYEYDENRPPAEITWGRSVLDSFPTRRAIIASHYILEADGTFGPQGQQLYDGFKDYPNVFLTLSGHVTDESCRVDTFGSNIMNSVMGDYQSRINGGNGLLQLLQFSPAKNTIEVKTYSPWVNVWENDTNSRYTLHYSMTPVVNYQQIGTVNNVASGDTAQLSTGGLLPNTTYQYYVVVNDGNNSTTSAVYTFTTAAMPAVNLGSDRSGCAPATFTLDAGSGYSSYTWNNGSHGTSLTVNSTGNYYVTTVDNIGCTFTDSVAVGIHPLPVIDINGVDSVCVGGSTQLTASGASTYVWSPSTYLDNPTSAHPVATPNADITYTVTGTTSFGCVGTKTITVTLRPFISPNVSATGSTTLCKGNSAPLSATGASTYTWLPTTGLNNASTPTPVATPDSTTTYSVTGIDVNGCSDVASVTIIVNPLPTVTASSNDTICSGSSAPISANGASTYMWLPASGLSNSNIASPVASPSVTTNYTVTGTDGNNCHDTAVVNILVNPKPNLNTSGDTPLCTGDSINLSVSGAFSYVWSPATGLSDNAISNPIAFPSTTTLYTVIGTNLYGCTDTASLTVTLLALPPAPTVTQTGDSIRSSVAAGYAWYLNGILIIGATNRYYTPPVNGNYSVTITDTNGCSASSAPFNFVSSGIEEEMAAQKWMIIPNPFFSKITLSLSDKKAGDVSITVTNELGEKVFDVTSMFTHVNNASTAMTKEIDLSFLPNGVYFISLRSEKNFYRQRIVKMD